MNGGNGSLNTKLQVFGGKDWNRWMIQTRVLCRDEDVVDLVNEGYIVVVTDATEAQRNTHRETRKKDHKALLYNHQCVDMNVFEKIVDSTAAKAAWDTTVQ